MRVLVPAWPPIDSRSITSASSPSDDAYTAAASPAGPAPTITTSYGPRRSISVRMRVPCCASIPGSRSTSGVPSWRTTTGLGAFWCGYAGSRSPSAESGRWNACGTPLRARCVRSA